MTIWLQSLQVASSGHRAYVTDVLGLHCAVPHSLRTVCFRGGPTTLVRPESNTYRRQHPRLCQQQPLDYLAVLGEFHTCMVLRNPLTVCLGPFMGAHGPESANRSRQRKRTSPDSPSDPYQPRKSICRSVGLVACGSAVSDNLALLWARGY